MPITDDLDRRLRTAAFIDVRRMLELRDPLTASDLARGISIRGRRHPGRRSGGNGWGSSFEVMKYARSIKTVAPMKSARVWYDDQRTTARHPGRRNRGDGPGSSCVFMGTDPDAADNRWLRETMENRIPLIYFLGAYPGHCWRSSSRSPTPSSRPPRSRQWAGIQFPGLRRPGG